MGQWDPNFVGTGKLGFTPYFSFAHGRLSARHWQPFHTGVCQSLPYIPFIVNFPLSSLSLIFSVCLSVCLSLFSHHTRRYTHFYLIQDGSLTRSVLTCTKGNQDIKYSYIKSNSPVLKEIPHPATLNPSPHCKPS